MFKGKKILFFSISFFGYQNEIHNKLIELGAEVDFFDERPSNTFWYKLLIRINKNLVKTPIDRYYKNIIKKTKNTDYDFVFFIKGEVVTPKILNNLKEHQEQAKYVLYLWDSIKHRQSVKKLFPLFDKVLSFDIKDLQAYPFLHFRPLFYLDTYSKIPLIHKDYSNDLVFVGTTHPDRYPTLMKVRDYFDDNNLKSYFFLYLQDWRMYYVWKVLFRSFKKAKKNDFQYKSINKEEVTELIKNAICVLDVEKSIQSGLTMRTLEVLGSRRKLITTNKTIKDYDFYNENNICIIDRENPSIPMKFIESNYQELNQEIYNKYSLEFWLREVFK